MPDRVKPRPSRPTMKAIADLAGVSRATVSFILANREKVCRRFRPETVERVRVLAKQLGYRANIMATSLRNVHSSFFGLIGRGLGEKDAISWHHQAFEGQFLAGSVAMARQLKLYPVLATQESADADASWDQVQGVLDGGAFGAIFRTPVPEIDDRIRQRIEEGFPIVRVFPDQGGSCPTNAIDMDNVAAGRLAAGLLGTAGRRRWVVVSDSLARGALALRERGAVEAARQHGASLSVLSMPHGLSESETIAWLLPAIRELHPDGVFAASSVAGVGTLLACRAAGLRVPEEVSLVGCDASLWRAPGSPSITSVDVSWYAAGELAVRKLAEMRDSEESVFENMLLPPVVRRGGTCSADGKNPPDVMSIET